MDSISRNNIHLSTKLQLKQKGLNLNKIHLRIENLRNPEQKGKENERKSRESEYLEFVAQVPLWE